MDIITCLNSALDKTVDFADEKKIIHSSRMGSSLSKAFFETEETPLLPTAHLRQVSLLSLTPPPPPLPPPQELPGSLQITPTGEMGGGTDTKPATVTTIAARGCPVHTCATKTALIRTPQSALRGLSNTYRPIVRGELASAVRF